MKDGRFESLLEILEYARDVGDVCCADYPIYFKDGNLFCRKENITQHITDPSKWRPYIKQKKRIKKRIAPALVKCRDEFRVTFGLFETMDLAKRTINTWLSNEFVKWPANDTSWIEIEEEIEE